MTTTITCPNPECRNTKEVNDEVAGKTVRCRRCGTSFTVSAATVAPRQSSFKDIFEAAKRGTVDDVQYFVEKNRANATTVNEDGFTPLHLAAQMNTNVEVLKYLTVKGAKVDAGDIDGMMPLHSAAACNSNIEVLDYLIEHQNADVNKKSPVGMTLLHIAAFSNPNVKVLEHLISKGANVTVKTTHEGLTPLDIADTEEKKRVLREAMQRR